MQSLSTAQPRKSFEEHLLDLNNYHTARAGLRAPFKQYQLAQLQLLANWEQQQDLSAAYSKLYQKMRRFSFLPRILARPASFEIIVPGRIWLFKKQLQKAGFEYNETAHHWRYQAVRTK